MKLFVILILSLLTLISPIKFYQPGEFIEKLRNISANETLLELGLKNMENFLKHYIYYNISSEPPQPDFNQSYHIKMDLPNLFKDIKIKDTNYFDFKNTYLEKIWSLSDLHTQPYFGILPVDYYGYVCPVELLTYYDKESGKPKMYSTLSLDKSYYQYFRDGENVYDKIIKNMNAPIKSINGKQPFDFIQNFARIKLRNPHSTYTFNEALYLKNNFYIPVTLEDLTNFHIVYENGDEFQTDYIVVDQSGSTPNDILPYNNLEDNDKFTSFLNEITSQKLSQDLFVTKNYFRNIDDIILDFEKKHPVKSHNKLLTPSKIKSENEEIKWDYEYKSKDRDYIVFQCRTDDINEVNVYKILNFGSAFDSVDSLNVSEKCAYLFDKNDYPIIMILPRNGGGNPIVGYNIIELANPYILTRNTLRFKKDEKYAQFIELYNTADLFVELNSTKNVNGSYFKDGFITEKYGDKTTEFSKPFCWKVDQKRIEEIKSKLKHKRKPTEIIAITDSFDLSAASAFLKNIYKSGAGIIVGFNGNPSLSDDIFDISTSPSAIFGINNYQNIYPDEINNIALSGIGLLTLTCIATFHEFQESHIPQEYDVQIADRRIKLYNPYTDEKYQDFINEAKVIFEEFKEKCNPKHDMLALFTDECKFSKHLHGGYKCGRDGKWNRSECIAVYCDTGFYYNKISNSCIEYPMEEEKERDNNLYLILGIVSGSIAIIIIIIIVFLYVKKKACFNKKKLKEKK